MGVGIVPIGTSLFLSTGSAVHLGIETLLKGGTVKDAVKSALDYHTANTELVTGKGTTSSEQQEWTKVEQRALVEAQIRTWAIVEYPQLIERFNIRTVEKEILVPLSNHVTLQSKVDASLQEKLGGDVINYSLKTCKEFDWRMEKSYKTDLQGITELYAGEHALLQHNKGVKKAAQIARELGDDKEISGNVSKWFKQFLGPIRVTAVKFCYLVKGKREEDKKDGLWKTRNSLIRAYRKFTPSGVEYAHSFFFNNPNNPSGWGRLGKGWESFNVWECEEIGGIKGWIKKLATGTIQPEEGDILKKWIRTPVEYFRNADEMSKVIKQITSQEEYVRSMISLSADIEESFPQHRHNCWYPQDCDYVPICHGMEQYTGKSVPEGIGEDPVGSGYYEWRRPHHKAEERQVGERLVQIEGVK